MRILLLFLILICLICPAELLSQEPPKDWIVKEESWFDATDPNVCVDQFESWDNYYLGGGKILRLKFIQPGHSYETTELIELDQETAEKFDIALANIRSDLGNLPDKVSSLPQEHVSYNSVNLSFKGKGDAVVSLRVVTNIRKDSGDGEIQKTGVEDLDFVIETLYTRKE